ncbi:MAG: ABC transporter substrate-binding protein [Spirochaetales bacterium]|nr:ABC transporter substrate-binding protein [Spirochaetales bacterium]
MKNKKGLYLVRLFLVLGSIYFLSACGANQAGRNELSLFTGIDEISYKDWEIGSSGGNLNVAIEAEPKTFNVVVSAESSTSDIVNRLFDYVAERDILTLQWEGRLVSGWEISEDQKSATFTMRPNLKWSDGQDLTAEDIVFSVNNVYLVKGVEGSHRHVFMVGNEAARFELIDKDHFKITTPLVYADIISLAHFQPVPKHIFQPLIESKGIEAVNSFWGIDSNPQDIVGCGPFVIDEYKPGQRLILKRNSNYWRKDAKGNSLPYLDTISLVIVEDRNTSFLKLQAGEVDTIEKIRGEDVATLLDNKDKIGVKVYNSGPESATNFLTINQNINTLEEPKKSWFNNKLFRQAMAHLIDRQTIIDNVYFGFAYPQYSLVPPYSPLFWKDVETVAPKFDPEAAKAILDSLEMKDRNNDGIREDKEGNPVSFVLQTNSDNTIRVKIGDIISQEMKKAGLDVTFKPGDFNTLVTALVGTFQWDMIIIGFTGSLQPFIEGGNSLPSRGNLHMTHPNQESPIRDWEKRVDQLYTQNTTTTNFEIRKKTGDEIQKIWVEECPWIYTVNEAAIFAFSKRVGNTKPRNIEPYDSWKGICEFLYIKK